MTVTTVHGVAASELLEGLQRRGITIALDDQGLSIRAPKGVLTDNDKRVLALNKERLLSHLRDPGIDPAVEDLPLTEVQQAYWVGRRSVALGNIGCHAYREFAAPAVDLGRLEAAWRRLVARHDMLRAIVTEEGRLRILPAVPDYRIEALDLAGRGDADARLAAVREAMSHQVFDPARWPLFDIRATLLDGEVRIHLGMDLLIADAASMLQLYREWGALYRDPDAVLPPIARRFADHLRSGGPSPAEQARAEAYWRERLPSLPGAPELPLAKVVEQIERPKFARHSRRLAPEAWAALRAKARAVGVTPSTLLLAAYADILATWSKSQHFLVTLTTFRAPPEFQGVVGDFTSTLLVEADARGATFRERLRALQARLASDLDHDGWSGLRVTRELARLKQGALASVPVVFTSALGHRAAEDSELPGAWLGRTAYTITQTPQVWIDHHVIEDGDGLMLAWDVLEELFAPGLIETMFAAYGRFLDDLARDDAAWSAPLGRHLPAEQSARRQRANATAATLPSGFLHEPVFACAERAPDRPAVIEPGRQVSYGELAAKARAVAEVVRRSGTGRDRLVGVSLEKGWEQVAAVLGVTAAGAAYLPIDPDLPEARRAYLAENGGLSLVLTRSGLSDRAWPAGVESVAVDTLTPAAGPLAPPPGARPTDLAYVIYTSGSTGRPKGVMIEHRAALNTVADINRRFGVGENDAVLGLSSLSFDLSVYDIFGVLGAGGRLVLPDPERLRDPRHWRELMQRHGVTVWNSVPALLTMLAEHGQELGRTLRVAMLSGDWVPLALPAQVKALAPAATVYALGGATEASIWSNWFEVDRVEPHWRSIPYGWPLANQSYHVLNDALEPAPEGVPGRLMIAGAGLARGYWSDPERSAAKFFVHPRSGERLYDTGDFGRYLPDGAIEFLGREDSQVKIRGHRVELGEIEAVLHEHPLVRAAVVLAPDAPGGERRLAAYVVANDPAPTPAVRPPSQEEADRLMLLLQRPSVRRPAGHDRVPLGLDPPNAALWRRRNSARGFLAQPVMLEALGALLSALRSLPGESGPLPKFRYPSAGSTYPLQAWVLVKPGRVAGLDGGLYYHHPDRHDLERVAPDLALPADAHAEVNRPLFEAAAFSLYLVADYAAIRPHYRDLARDFCLIEAGYVGQLLTSEAAACGLGLCPIGIVENAALAGPLGLGPKRELVHSFLGGVPGPAATASVAPAREVTQALRDWLAERLPNHVVPQTIVRLDALPLTANGKLDRSRLPDPAPTAPPPGAARLKGAMEETVAEVFAEVLALPSVEREKVVFDLGGTSVHMVRIHRRLEQRLGRSIDIIDLFRFPSVAALAAHLASVSREAGAP